MWQFSDFVVVVQASVLITGVNLCWKIVPCISCALLLIEGSGGQKNETGKGQPDQKLCDVIWSYKVKENKNQRNGSTLYDLNYNTISALRILFFWSQKNI